MPSNGALGDVNINASDTYFSLDIDVTGSVDLSSSGEPFYDPATGGYTNIVTIQTTPEQHHLEGGYDINGNTLVSYYVDDEGSQSDGVFLTHLTNDNVALYDRQGMPIVDEDSQQLIGLTGSLVNQIDPTTVVIPLSGGSACLENRPSCFAFQPTRLLPGVREPVTATTTDTTSATVPPTSTSRRGGAWTQRGNTLEYAFTDNFIADPDALGDVNVSPRSASSPDASGGTHTLHYTQSYRRDEQRTAWILDHIDRITEHKSNGFSLRISHHERFSHVRGVVNRDQEKHRDSVRTAAPRIKPRGAGNSDSQLTNLRPPVTSSNNLTFGGNTTLDRSPAGSALRLTMPGPVFDVLTHPGSGTGPALVLQHGILSSEGTWTGYMAGQLSHGGGFDNASAIFIPSLSGLDSLEGQIIDLRGRVLQNGVAGSSTVYIGHSQGGLIARRLGQESPSLVGAVVTIGSPNLGAPLFNNSETAIGQTIGLGAFQAEVQVCHNKYNAILCPIISSAEGVVMTQLIHYGLSSISASTRDLTVGSTFLANSLHDYEGFRRASIASNARNPWRFARLLGDMLQGCDASGFCKGRSLAKKTEIAYKAVSGCSFLSRVFGYLGFVGNACGATRDVMLGFEAVWDRLISNKQASDAIVPVSSQHYPNNPGTYQAQRFYIDDGDSHAGETRSLWTRDALVNQALPSVNVH